MKKTSAKYSVKRKLQRVMDKAGKNARRLGIKASDVSKIVKEFHKKNN